MHTANIKPSNHKCHLIAQRSINNFIPLQHTLLKGRKKTFRKKNTPAFLNNFVCQSLITYFITTYNHATYHPFNSDVACCVVCSLTPSGSFNVYSSMALHSM